MVDFAETGYFRLVGSGDEEAVGEFDGPVEKDGGPYVDIPFENGYCRRILFSMLREGKKDEEIEEALMKLSQDLEIKVNGVFQPIRVAITNSQVSLPLFDSISLLGLDEAERRLQRALRMIKEK